MEWLAQRTPAAVILDPWNGAAVLATAYLDLSAAPDEEAASARAIVLRPGPALGQAAHLSGRQATHLSF